MTFNAFEQSIAGGRPVRLYQFSRGVVQWRYTNADRDITHLTQVYRSLRGGISDEGISQGGEVSTQNIRIKAPGDLEVALMYRGIPPSDVVELVVFDGHYGDDEYRVAWVGEIQYVQWPAQDRCTITCSPESVAAHKQGLRLCWERQCPHSIYGRGCNVDRELFRVEGSIIATDGAAVEVSAASGYPDGWFNAGYIEWPIGSGLYERRAIEDHSVTSLSIFGGTSGIPLGQAIAMFPGCDQTPETCHDKFDNLDNNGGQGHLTDRSPYDGDPVF